MGHQLGCAALTVSTKARRAGVGFPTIATLASSAALAVTVGGCAGGDGPRLSVWSERALTPAVDGSLKRAGIEPSIVGGDSTALLERAAAGRLSAADVVVVETFSPVPFDPAHSRPARILASDALATIVPRRSSIDGRFVYRPRALAIAGPATALGKQTRVAFERVPGENRPRPHMVPGGAGDVVASVLRGDSDAGVVLRSTLRLLPVQRRARLEVVDLAGLPAMRLLVTASISRTTSPARQAIARRWMRAATTSASLRAAGLDAPYREP
jgi:hypothetical protein